MSTTIKPVTVIAEVMVKSLSKSEIGWVVVFGRQSKITPIKIDTTKKKRIERAGVKNLDENEGLFKNCIAL